MESSHPNYPGGKAIREVPRNRKELTGKFTLNSGPKRNGIEEDLGTFLTGYVDGEINHEKHCDVKTLAMAVLKQQPEFLRLHPIRQGSRQPHHNLHFERRSLTQKILWTTVIPAGILDGQLPRNVQDKLGQIRKVSSWHKPCPSPSSKLKIFVSLVEHHADFNIKPSRVGNMDQKNVQFDLMFNTTIAKTGTKNHFVESTEEKGVGGRATSSLTAIGMERN
ncbi:hypothetical protein BC829DRAFT_417771 [Chytridium lagenaria]|nr:hypothetical protein BC829DRAFT_417771 [Chytridium lagenaria]